MITFKFIHQLKLPEIDKLLEIVSDQENMKEIGNGLTWDKHKIIDLMNYSNYDYKNKFKDVHETMECKWPEDIMMNRLFERWNVTSDLDRLK